MISQEIHKGVAGFFQTGFFSADYENLRARKPFSNFYAHIVLTFIDIAYTISIGTIHNIFIVRFVSITLIGCILDIIISHSVYR